MAPMLKAAWTGSSSQAVPGTRAPPGNSAPGTTGPSSLAQSGIAQRQKCAAQTVHQAQPGRLVGRRALDRGAHGVVGHVDKDLVRRGPVRSKPRRSSETHLLAGDHAHRYRPPFFKSFSLSCCSCTW